MDTRGNSGTSDRPKVEFTNNTLFVDGRYVHTAADRPKRESMKVINTFIEDFVMVTGAVVTAALGVSELLASCSKKA